MGDTSTNVPVFPVCPHLGAHMRARRDKVLETLASLSALHTRDTGGNYGSSVHRYEGPIMLTWNREDPAVTAIMRLGPMAGSASLEAGRPHLHGSTLILDAEPLGTLPQTVMTAMAGRTLGEVLDYPNPFLAGIAATAIDEAVMKGDALHLRLAMDLEEWDALDASRD